MRLIYIAGSYRSDTEDGLFENIYKARKAAKHLWADGWVAVCPHLNSAFMGGVVDEMTFLLGGLEILRRCDAVYVLKDSENSKGTQAEVKLAEDLGMLVLYE